MSPKDHIIFGAGAAAAFYPYLGGGSAAFFAASVAIDADHYIEYVYHNGYTDFSPARMFGFHREIFKLSGRPDFLNIEVFHTVEFMSTISAAALFTGSQPLMAAFYGMAFHIILDMIFLARRGMFFKRSYTAIEYIIRKRRLGKMGMNPGDVYRSALKSLKESPAAQ
jgi:hypothetical protein